MTSLMLDNLKQMLIDRKITESTNIFSDITNNDQFTGNEPIIDYENGTCVIIALTSASKKNIIDQLKPNTAKKNKENEEETDIHKSYKDFVANFNKSVNYIMIFEELTTTDNKYLINFDKILNKINGLLSVFMYSDLHFNPTKHCLVDKHIKLTESEITELMTKYNIKSKTQLPIILKSDPIAKWLGIKPGDIVKINRYNQNSGLLPYYRACV
jgi:DNA-directed RNA polymerase subunit H (RpoH/RPB5)